MKTILTLITATLLTVAAQAAEQTTQYPEITIPELKAAIAAGKVTLLDANGTESWQGGHIPGAIDYDGSKAKLLSLLPKDKHALVVAYCGGPLCMAYKKAAADAEKLGYTNIKHLKAGIRGWKTAGEAVEKGN